MQLTVIYINDTTFKLLQGNGDKNVYISMNDEPALTILNCITQPIMICVVIM